MEINVSSSHWQEAQELLKATASAPEPYTSEVIEHIKDCEQKLALLLEADNWFLNPEEAQVFFVALGDIDYSDDKAINRRLLELYDSWTDPIICTKLREYAHKFMQTLTREEAEKLTELSTKRYILKEQLELWESEKLRGLEWLWFRNTNKRVVYSILRNENTNLTPLEIDEFVWYINYAQILNFEHFIESMKKSIAEAKRSDWNKKEKLLYFATNSWIPELIEMSKDFNVSYVPDKSLWDTIRAFKKKIFWGVDYTKEIVPQFWETIEEKA